MERWRKEEGGEEERGGKVVGLYYQVGFIDLIENSI